MTATSTWYHHLNRTKGRRKPRVYPVRVEYDLEQIDFERTARQLGFESMSRFFFHAGRVLIWLLAESAIRAEQIEAEKEREHAAEQDKARLARNAQTRHSTEYKRLLDKESELDRREKELRQREGKP